MTCTTRAVPIEYKTVTQRGKKELLPFATAAWFVYLALGLPVCVLLLRWTQNGSCHGSISLCPPTTHKYTVIIGTKTRHTWKHGSCSCTACCCGASPVQRLFCDSMRVTHTNNFLVHTEAHQHTHNNNAEAPSLAGKTRARCIAAAGSLSVHC